MLVREIAQLLKSQNKTIAVAESCTGGLISKLLTDIPGSSRYFILGVVTYSNFAKTKILSIPKPLLSKYGAVSKPVAQKLAQNVRKLAKADFGIGITGIAGPGGGSKEKPVGTVYICVGGKNKNICKKYLFKGSRSMIRKKATTQTLRMLRDCVMLNV